MKIDGTCIINEDTGEAFVIRNPIAVRVERHNIGLYGSTATGAVCIDFDDDSSICVYRNNIPNSRNVAKKLIEALFPDSQQIKIP